jgi:hypothetical protein
MHSFACDDAKGQGGALRAGRFFLYAAKSTQRLKLEWSFLPRLNWFEVTVRVGGEDAQIGVCLILPVLALLSVSVSVPQRWLSWWMVEDRVFGAKFGYVGSIARLYLGYAQWAEECGMTDYYRQQRPRKHSDLQLWPGLEIVIRFPPLLRWIFGAAKTVKSVVATKPVAFEMDGRRHEGTWTLERFETRRARWPWAYGVRESSWIEMPNPPQFAGKGENSWDCGDDGIYGAGSREVTAAGALGDYVKAVLRNRERYGMPSEVLHA